MYNYVWKIKKKQGIDPILRCEMEKSAENMRLGIDIFSYVWRKSLLYLHIELLNQKSEILNIGK